MLAFVYFGEPLPIVGMFDFFCEETDDPDLAVAMVAVMDDGNFLAMHCRREDIVELRVH